jgi:methyltransferase
MFYGFMALLTLQRIFELVIARQNETRLKNKGGLEFGTSHYPWMVLMHIGFFCFLMMEVTLLHKTLSSIWPVWLSLFLLAQIGRIWVITTLGLYWNTKIIVVPDAEVVASGPYKYIKHPNYLIVAIEIIVISMLFHAVITAAVFTCLNAMMMRIRIPIEERALTNLTTYQAAFRKSKVK